jgi:hypothetical protein
MRPSLTGRVDGIHDGHDETMDTKNTHKHSSWSSRSSCSSRVIRGSDTRVLALLGPLALFLLSSCSPGRRAGQTAHGTYDKTSGKLTQIASDSNHNGRIDTWTDMDGSRPLRSRIDLDEDGKIDRWEYYDGTGALLKVGFSRTKGPKPDAWAFSRPDGSLEHIDISSTADEARIDRREFYEGGVMVRAEEDTNADGRPDKWERYDHGVLKTVEFDEDHDAKPDRRFTYEEGELTTIESQPDGRGGYLKKEPVQR